MRTLISAILCCSLAACAERSDPAPAAASPSTPLSVTAVGPTSGPTTGGTVLLIAGTGFKSGVQVQIGGVPATNVTVLSSTALQATTPAGVAGIVGVAVLPTEGPVAQLANAFTYVAPPPPPPPPPVPTITAITPVTGPTAGGTTVTITGTSFAAGATVLFGGSAATVTALTATSVTAVTPAGAAGAANVTVTNAGATPATLANGFTYIAPPPPAPAIAAVNPATGPAAGGTAITITGSNFVAGVTVQVGGAVAGTTTLVSSTVITAVTPAGTAGSVSVTVTNPGAVPAVLTNGFTYVAPPPPPGPAITSVGPAQGPTVGGTTLTINGSNFATGATVVVGATPATGVTFVSSSRLTAVTPPGTAGAANVLVTNPGGAQATLVGGFTYQLPPTAIVTSVSPAVGQTGGGSPVTIYGSYFQAGATVRLGNTAATNVVVVSNSRITCTTPASTPGTVAVLVSNPGAGPGTAGGAYTYIDGLRFDRVSPSSGPASGSTVAVHGVGFQPGVTVTFDGLLATNVTVINEYRLTCTTPQHVPLAVTVVVTNATAYTNPSAGYAAQSGTRNRAFLYTGSTLTPGPSAPVVPAEGPACGGTTVTLTGSGFLNGATVRFGAIPATNVQVLSGSVITCTAPPAPSHTTPVVGVTVTNPNTTTWSVAPPVAGYVYRPAPIDITHFGNYGSFHPDVAVDGNGNIHAVWLQSERVSNYVVTNLRHRRSTDGGKTWSPSQVLYVGAYWGSAAPTGRPAIAASGSDVAVVWNQGVFNMAIQRTEWEPWITGSTDGGQTWGTAGKLSTFVASQWATGWPAGVAITPGGTVVVAAEGQHTGTVLPNVGVFVTTGTIGGAFSTPQLLSSAGRTAGAPSVGVQSNSTWHVLWGAGNANTRNCFHTRTTNGGTAWSTPAALTTGGGVATTQCVANGARVIAGWAGNNGAGLTVRSSTNAGASFNTAVGLGNAAGYGATAPRLALDGGATVVALYDSWVGGGPADVVVRRSTDGGATWGAAANLSLMTGKLGTNYCSVGGAAWTGSRFYVVWRDPTLGHTSGRIAGY